METSQETQLALMAQSIKRIDDTLAALDRKLEKVNENLISKTEFSELKTEVHTLDKRVDGIESEGTVIKSDIGYLKKVVFGAIGIILTVVLVAVIALVVVQKNG